jgi:hypothetical protein
MQKYTYIKSAINFGEWLSFVLMPALFFPLFWVIATLLDWQLGDSNVILRLTYDSKGQVLSEFMHDWVASLPLSMSMSWLVLLPAYYFISRKAYSRRIVIIVIGVAAWVGMGILYFKSHLLGVITMLASGSVFVGGLLLLSNLYKRDRSVP